MATRRISVNVGGLWRTEVELEEEATWLELIYKIQKVTGIWTGCQRLTPSNNYNNKCELEEGDDVFCDWELPNGRHPLHNAAFDVNIEAIRSWVASGADINVTNKHKTTPLMYACSHAYLYSKEECMMELLRLGANANAIDDNNCTVLHIIACYYNLNKIEKMERMAKILIKAGCDPTKRNNKNETFIDILKKEYYNDSVIKLEEWIKEQTEQKMKIQSI